MRVLAILPLAAALALAACGSKVINTDKAETEIEKGLKQQLHLQNVSVDCPSNVKAKKGDTFNCTAKSGKQTAKILVTQEDDNGRIRWRLVRG
jgi:Domain of unknown function (DUF4333)